MKPELVPKETSQFDITTVIYPLNRIALTIGDAVTSLAMTKDVRAKERIKHFDNLVSNITTSATLVPPTRQAISKELESEHEMHIERLLSWGLVMLWTNFEAQMEDLLRSFFKAKPKAFLNWGGKLSITYEDVHSIEEMESVVDTFHSKALRQFTDSPIKERIKDLQRKLGIPEEKLFGYEYCTDDVRSQLTEFNSQYFENLSSTRNEVAHKQAVPFRKFEQLELATLYLERLLTNLGIILAGKMGIPVTLHGMTYLTRPDEHKS